MGGARGLAVWASQSCAVALEEPVRTDRPSGLKVTTVIEPPWDRGEKIDFPVPTSHQRTLPSSEPVRAVRPSGLRATAWTGAGCRSGGASGAPVRAFQS